LAELAEELANPGIVRIKLEQPLGMTSCGRRLTLVAVGVGYGLDPGLAAESYSHSSAYAMPADFDELFELEKPSHPNQPKCAFLWT
jgi:hypothetical protein